MFKSRDTMNTVLTMAGMKTEDVAESSHSPLTFLESMYDTEITKVISFKEDRLILKYALKSMKKEAYSVTLKDKREITRVFEAYNSFNLIGEVELSKHTPPVTALFVSFLKDFQIACKPVDFNQAFSTISSQIEIEYLKLNSLPYSERIPSFIKDIQYRLLSFPTEAETPEWVEAMAPYIFFREQILNRPGVRKKIQTSLL